MRGLWGIFEGGFTMTNDLMLIAIGLLVAFNIGHFATLKRCEAALLSLTLESQRLTSFDPSDIVAQFQEEAASIIANVNCTSALNSGSSVSRAAINGSTASLASGPSR